MVILEVFTLNPVLFTARLSFKSYIEEMKIKKREAL